MGHVTSLFTKELVKNKLPISWAFRNSTVVPLGQVIVKEYFHVVFEISGVFASGLICLVEAPHRHAQASGRLRTFDELPCNVYGMEDHALAGAWMCGKTRCSIKLCLEQYGG